MLGQLLLTGLVIAGVYLYWRHQQKAETGERPAKKSTSARQRPLLPKQPATPVKGFVVALVVTALLASGAFAIYDWRDKRTVLEVTVVNPVTGSREEYRVYKKDLQENAFTTRNGQHIRIASSERLEVRRAED
jgi:glycerol uptake facilitator-like aquaporin